MDHFLVDDRISVFSRLQLPERSPASHAYYRLAPLAGEEEAIYPMHAPQEEPEARKRQAEMFLVSWEAARSRLTDTKSLYTYLLGLLTRFAWCLPASGADDIPLVDQVRVTAAVAVALDQYAEAKGSTSEDVASDPVDKPLCLMGVDFAGIQRYLFATARGKGVAKRLRARSFFVSMVLEAMALKILDACGLPLTNLLFSGGGKFYLLLPNTPGTLAEAEKVIRDEEEWLFKRYAGQVTLAVGSAACTLSEFGALRCALQAVERAMQGSKLQPYRSILQSDEGWNEGAFVLVSAGDSDSICTGCRQERAEPDKELCSMCADDEELGRSLANASYLAYYRNHGPDRIQAGPGLWARVSQTPSTDEDGLLWIARLNDTDLIPVAGRPVYTRFLANAVPLYRPGLCIRCDEPCRDKERMRPGMPVYFECMAAAADGKPYLGYLKMDVDNLGTLLTSGLPRESAAPARLLAVCRMLEFFFGAHIDGLLRGEKYADCYTIFSGGDDLSAVGPWNQILDLAEAITKDFRRFTANNPSITISAGVALADARYPVHLALAGAEESLKAAKSSGERGAAAKTKNRCWAFGETLGWQDFARALEEGKRLVGWVKARKATRGFIQRLLFYWQLYRLFAKDHKVEGLRYLPLLAFDLARNFALSNSKYKDKEWMDLRLWAQGLLHPQSPSMAAMGVIASYARLATTNLEVEAEEDE